MKQNYYLIDVITVTLQLLCAGSQIEDVARDAYWMQSEPWILTFGSHPATLIMSLLDAAIGNCS